MSSSSLGTDTLPGSRTQEGSMKVKQSGGQVVAAGSTEEQLLRKPHITPEDVLLLQKITAGQCILLQPCIRARPGSV